MQTTKFKIKKKVKVNCVSNEKKSKYIPEYYCNPFNLAPDRKNKACPYSYKAVSCSVVRKNGSTVTDLKYFILFYFFSLSSVARTSGLSFQLS
jgi:hypothetical protein